MRIFAFILSVYLAGLSVLSCADSMPQNSVDTNTELLTEESSHDNSNHKDDCTPFCACTSCGQLFIIPFLNASIKVQDIISTDFFFHYAFDYSFDFSEGVWHPPAHS